MGFLKSIYSRNRVEILTALIYVIFGVAVGAALVINSPDKLYSSIAISLGLIAICFSVRAYQINSK